MSKKSNNKMNNTHSWATPIDKLMLWKGSWQKYDSKLSNVFLRIHFDLLIITADSKILESFNMHHKIKGIYKDDVLILIINNISKEIRKIKFQIKSNLEQCLQLLGQHFPVISHTNMQANNVINVKYRNIDDVLKHALENKQHGSSSVNVPNNFNNFIKLCLMDPTFPQLVFEAEKIINNVIGPQ